MIHAFALEPRLVATWGRRQEFRFFHDKFGLGTPRALLECPGFSKWKRKVHEAALEQGLSEEDLKRLEELFRIFAEHRCRRPGLVYDGVLTWLQNAENEHRRREFAGIVATANPNRNPAVLVGDQLGPADGRWARPMGASPERTPEALAAVLSAMLMNCRVLHLVDPYFLPDNPRHRRVLEAFMDVLAFNGTIPEVIRVHCSAERRSGSADPGVISRAAFESAAAQMSAFLPTGVTIEFARWRQREGGDRLHNRYVLTELGGVSLGVGLDAGRPGETDDVLLLPREQYASRWGQYAEQNGRIELFDAPTRIVGARPFRRT